MNYFFVIGISPAKGPVRIRTNHPEIVAELTEKIAGEFDWIRTDRLKHGEFLGEQMPTNLTEQDSSLPISSIMIYNHKGTQRYVFNWIIGYLHNNGWKAEGIGPINMESDLLFNSMLLTTKE